jgi:hypothetical protein
LNSIPSINCKVEIYANLSRVEELISDTNESEDCLITDELIYHEASLLLPNCTHCSFSNPDNARINGD